jgi:hypothetical protein
MSEARRGRRKRLGLSSGEAARRATEQDRLHSVRIRPDQSSDQRSEERKSRRRREVLEASMDQYAMTDGGRPKDDEVW